LAADKTLIATQKPRSIPPAAYVIGVALLAGLAGFLYLNRKAQQPPPPPPPLTGPAKAYVRFLKLSEVNMEAHESYMKQQVVEITGKIGNTGDRILEQVVLNCPGCLRPGGLARARTDCQQEDGRPRAQRHEAVPYAFRQHPRELESGAARPGDRGD
jgi:hypothetical protein